MANLTGQTLASSFSNVLTKGSGATPIQDGVGAGHFYSEGTWTPTMVGTTTLGTYTLTIINAEYIKIGRQVFINARFTVTVDSAGTGVIGINGLPFPRKANTIINSNIDFSTITKPANYTAYRLTPRSISTGNTETVLTYDTSTGTTSINVSDITNISTGTEIRIAATYITD